VLLFRTLPGEDRTSMEVYAEELERALRRVAGPDVEVASWRPDSRLRVAAGSARPLRRIGGYLDRYARYQWQARGQPADLNHIVDHGYGHLAFSFDPRRTVVTFHDAMLLKLEARELPTDAYPWFAMLGHRLSLAGIRRAARVITDSESSKRDLLRFTDCDPDRVHVVPLGVSDRFRPPSTPGRGSVGDGRRRVLHVGHCGAYKNVEAILRVVEALGPRFGGRLMFTKVGGPFTDRQRALIARLGIEDRVEHLGAVPLDDLPRTYAGADLLLMPSLHEGFGLPVLEAMACGTPVVASNQGSLPEVVGDAGLCVDPTDTAAIAEAVATVLTDDAVRDRLRQRGLERARLFGWERTARETLSVYESVYKALG
jgi:glycosyltransferase involved in cell wall biosynthesis